MQPPQMMIERNEGRNAQVDNRDHRIDRKELKTKISSRQDFVLLFGFEREFRSRIFSPAQALYFMALHNKGAGRKQEAAEAT